MVHGGENGAYVSQPVFRDEIYKGGYGGNVGRKEKPFTPINDLIASHHDRNLKYGGR